jgi:UBA-like domain
MDGLTPDQVAAVAQLRELTNGSDEEVAVNVLRSVDWDVEVGFICPNRSELHSTAAR